MILRLGSNRQLKESLERKEEEISLCRETHIDAV